MHWFWIALIVVFIVIVIVAFLNFRNKKRSVQQHHQRQRHGRRKVVVSPHGKKGLTVVPASSSSSSPSSSSFECDDNCDEAGASSKSPITWIAQSDLKEGPYRIKTPGRYAIKYPTGSGPKKLIYNPNPASARTDVPLTGQICAISIECSNVELDLNGGTIETGDNVYSLFPPGSKASAPFLNYSTILLANAAFPAFIANTPIPGGIMKFLDAPAYVGGTNIVIRNGTIAESPHFGIYGPQGHGQVRIEDLCVKGCVISGITINATTKVCIKNVVVDGKITKPVNFHLPASHLIATKQLVDQTLQQLPSDPLLNLLSGALNGDIAAAYANEAKGLTSTPNSTTTQYGIALQSGPSSVFFPYANRALVAQANAGTGMSNIGSACLKNVTVKNITNSNAEVPLIGYTTQTYVETDNKSPMFGKPWAGAPGTPLLLRNVNPFAQTLKWEDLGVQPDGSLQPNNFLKANAYLMLLAQNTPASPTIVIHPAFALAILAPSPTLASIVPFVQPVFGLAASGDFLRGTTGIVVRGFDKCCTKNIKIENLRNTSAVPLTLADIPGGSSYSSAIVGSNFGSFVWGLFVQAGAKFSARNVSLKNLKSDVGQTFALHIIDVEAFDVEKVRASGLAGGSERYLYQVLEADFSTVSSEREDVSGGLIKKLYRGSLSGPITANVEAFI